MDVIRVLVKAPGCPIHVEHAENSLGAFKQIIGGENINITKITEEWAILSDADAVKKGRAVNCTLDESRFVGRIILVGMEDGCINEFNFKYDKEIKQRFPNLWR